ncbi:hypothetical protein BDM02DRAFT_3132803 [Thelephora ganbajun]|uniref:Uncharacterized protein n=1 Tax=Thelephora ganbajun TaxID=370292 RepID=A0ACB6Z042_THEGA|nr:hypothetical protein BDM02DRAFT_3132803 [Thelephora ganbajun]
MVTGGPCVLNFSFSPEVEWALSSHQHVLIILLASPFHKRHFLRVASRKAQLGYSYLLLTHHLLEHPIVILPFWTSEAFDSSLREEGRQAESKGGWARRGCVREDHEMGDVRVQMMELKLAWEQREVASSSGYISAGGEEAALVEEGMEEERVEEEEDMGEEGLCQGHQPWYS